ncbi:MAG: 2-oxoglutarate dehydrogenase, E2 component, dihydrolipoamide succinyltransferase [Pyrinomonadaceae bacterium]|nr:2-oxoglutarate dehydrogenase, E2 component, dihydrolipoamide succinyltransferase [Pyrinomonadaceae bacterium]MBP6212628.1 2-oxoglutarate dehydrogenase, E2 component, dihydrolipoamide succinyltransferase [Pyrinomonadaceae bacterium]
MSIEVVMPQMGESITEGTVSKWLKQVGERVEKDEPVLEISTDKVDAEVPSPGAGILLEIRHQEGETVEVGTVVAVIGSEVGVASESPAPTGEAPTIIATSDTDGTEPSVETSAPEATIIEAIPTEAPAESSSADAAEVVMPQMGESITEGTVSKWLKSVGDTIEKDEALLEISTDKVDAEVPSPTAGTILAIHVKEGETVEVGAVLALVGTAGGTVTPTPKPEPSVEQVAAPKAVEAPIIARAATAAASPSTGSSLDELLRIKSSPLVRNIAREHGVDITRIPGSGISGRVTKEDILSFIESGAALRPQDLLVKGATLPTPPATPTPAVATFTPQQTFVAMGDRIEKMSVMRKKIAEHMTSSKQTSAHVTSVYEIDMTNVAKFRKAHQADFQTRFGTKLTFMPFIFQAVTAAIREFRIVNSQVDGDQIIYKGDINLGMAVALDWGLIVPVIRQADTLTLSELAIAANDLADRARTKKLKPDEVQGGTFTITNPGVFGGLYGTPIINQPQVAILCVGTIEKRAKVLTSPDGDDYIAIRQMAYFALTYDHRIVDGADAERFLAYLKKYLENAEFTY